MKKLLELKKLEKEVQEALNTIELPEDLYVCYHSHYETPSFSIYTDTRKPFKKLNTIAYEYPIDYFVDNTIDDQVADEIISQIEEVLK